MKAIIDSALRTIEIGKAGLTALEEAVRTNQSHSFVEAVKCIVGISGRVIVTGVGKSGHIGSKIAATFASTGTPAFFVHSAEANHGDLGMIGCNDVVLAISWSGETTELKGIVNYSRRFHIPIIALTSCASSTLGRESDIILTLPYVTEACPHGLAPTTSTLIQLAMGDALAIAMLEARGFTIDDFKTFHPGGSLGASLTRVHDVMHRDDELPLVPLGTSMSAAMGVLSRKRFGCVGIIDQHGLLVGIVTDGDLARNLHRNLSTLNADDIMTRAPKTVSQYMLASTAISLLNEHNIGALLVTEDNRPIGIVHFHDLLRIGVA